jgi:hypothetical protein
LQIKFSENLHYSTEQGAEESNMLSQNEPQKVLILRHGERIGEKI